MRDIRFRALAKDGTWRYGELNHLAPEMSNTHYSLEIFWQLYHCSRLQRQTLGQYIGFKVNGTSIYAGDLLVIDDSDIGGTLNVGEVVWCDDPTLSNLEWGLWVERGYHPTNFLGHLELIGNIHGGKDAN